MLNLPLSIEAEPLWFHIDQKFSVELGIVLMAFRLNWWVKVVSDFVARACNDIRRRWCSLLAEHLRSVDFPILPAMLVFGVIFRWQPVAHYLMAILFLAVIGCLFQVLHASCITDLTK